MPLIPALRGREAEAGGSFKFEASLIYTVSSRTARVTQKNPVLKKTKQNLKSKISK